MEARGGGQAHEERRVQRDDDVRLAEGRPACWPRAAAGRAGMQALLAAAAAVGAGAGMQAAARARC